MTPERWQQVKGVLASVLDVAPSERGPFLDKACDGDRALRDEVESLLSAGVEGWSGFLQSPPTAPLAKGTHVGDYEIQSLLGAGGMGEVYRARDLRLRRDVAVKVLPAVVSSDPDRLRRFEQEATAAAALNHPNVLAVHQLGMYAGTPYLVSELLEGETLRELISRGRLAPRRAIDYGVQIASGLTAAHEKGIVHRDLKPENLFLTKDGRVKILDFGLAKLTQPHSGADHSAPTIGGETKPGLVMGTVGYMSPEQVRGHSVDHRADIFAFGTILYEMLTGNRAFWKPTSPETMTAILHDDPPGISKIAPGLTPALQRIVRRCLEKNPDQRFQSASDLAFALAALTDTQEVHPAQRKKISKIVMGAAILLLAGLIAAVLYYHSRPGRRLTDKDTIVLADFANTTGDPVFDNTLKTALNVSLRQSPFLNVLSDSEVAKTLQQMTRPADTELTAAVAREVCEREGSKAYLVGSVGSLGTEYVLGLKAVNCQTGATLAQDQVTAASKDKVLNELGRMAARFRNELGESLTTLPQYDVPLAEATTSSLEALKAYSLGERAFREKGVDALPHYQRAIALDPNFAMAYAAIGLLYATLGEPERASENYTKAFQLREHASEREKLSIEAAYYTRVTNELDKASRVYQEEIRTYPKDAVAYRDLGSVYSAQGLWEKAAETGSEAVRLAPDWVVGYEALANDAIDLQQLDETRQIIERAHARNLDDPGLHIDLYALAFLASDAKSMEEQRQWFSSNPEYENTGLGLHSDTEAFAGHLEKARELTERAIDSAIRADNKEGAGVWKEIASQREAVFGNTTKARLAAEQGLKLDPASPGIEVEAALALAMIGDATRAEELARELDRHYPLDTQMQSIWLPAVRGQVAIKRGDPALALDALHAPSTIELGNVRFVNNGSCLYSTYVRGEAYLAAGQGNAAAAEFQKILDHSGIVWNCWTGALAQLGVARANALQAKSSQGADADTARVRALAAYKDFLTLWKDADSDIPILKQAKSEYAKLQ